MHLLIERIDFIKTIPQNGLLSDREPNEAYLLANEGKQYALYFPKDMSDGSVNMDMTNIDGNWKLTWLNIEESIWLDQEFSIRARRFITSGLYEKAGESP